MKTLGRLFWGLVLVFASVACLSADEEVLSVSQIGENLRFPGSEVVMNTTANGSHVFVSGYFGEKGPYNIIVDTGAGANVIDTELANELGLQVTGAREVLSGGVEPVMSDIVVVPEVKIDDLSVIDADFITIELGKMSMGQFHGVLGMELFSEAILTFDPTNQLISVATGDLDEEDPSTLKLINDGNFGMQFEIDVAGQSVPMVFDTGAPSTFSFPFALSDTFPLRGELKEGPTVQLVGGNRSVWLGELDGSIKVAELEYENAEVAFLDPSPGHGHIGNAILNDLVLRVDQKNKLLGLERATANSKKTSEEEKSPRRVGIQLRGVNNGQLTIIGVEAGSIGERAGFKSGDKLLTVNGKQTQEYDMRELGTLFRSNNPLRIEVEREGEVHIINIQ